MKFTISHHIDSCPHYDIFLERENHLETWSVMEEKFPDLMDGVPVACAQKSPHRKIYLTFQGELTDDRGTLTIIDEGEYNTEDTGYLLHGLKMTGRLFFLLPDSGIPTVIFSCNKQ